MREPEGVSGGDRTHRYHIAAYYWFRDQSAADLPAIQQELINYAAELSLRGLFILGTEGINSTVAAPHADALHHWKQFIRTRFDAADITFKDSWADKPPFRKFIVKIRDEICTAGHPHLFPGNGANNHISPQEWNNIVREEADVVIIDTRNDYEYRMGTFKGAINPATDKFTDFFDSVDNMNLPKDKKILLFCTGGIRCHKGIGVLQERGYNNVYQLHGGILKYIEEFPNQEFEGECFVFDHRVSVDQKLEPSQKYGLCPHCGEPGSHRISCSRCSHKALICDNCAEIEAQKEACSKHCAAQLRLSPGKKARHQFLPFELEQERFKTNAALAD